MKQEQQIQTKHSPSRLERFSIGFEYDKTLREIKQDVHTRTIV